MKTTGRGILIHYRTNGAPTRHRVTTDKHGDIVMPAGVKWGDVLSNAREWKLRTTSRELFDYSRQLASAKKGAVYV